MPWKEVEGVREAVEVGFEMYGVDGFGGSAEVGSELEGLGSLG